MRFLADENFPGSVVDSLISEGHDVLWARITFPGAKDKALLARAQMENRIVLTFDKDFGALAFLFGLPASCGVVLFRLATSSPGQLHERTLMALHQKIDWAGHFVVVEENRVHMTPVARSQTEPRALGVLVPMLKGTNTPLP